MSYTIVSSLDVYGVMWLISSVEYSIENAVTYLIADVDELSYPPDSSPYNITCSVIVMVMLCGSTALKLHQA